MDHTTPATHGEPTASAALPQAMIAFAAERGVPPPALIERFALDLPQLASVDGRVPLRTLGRMWQELPELLGEPDLPFALAAWTERAEPPLIILFVLSSATLGAGYGRLLRYERLLHYWNVMQLDVDAHGAHWTVHPERAPEPPPAASIVFAAVVTVLLARRALERDVVPTEVTFRHAAPADARRYTEVFGVPVRFGAELDRVTLPDGLLAAPIPSAARNLERILATQLDAQLAAISPVDREHAATRDALRALLPDGPCTVASVARALRTSPRTLQRRLTTSGTSLRDVLDEVRRDLALRYIRNPTISLVEIAFALGFADQTTFHRAFLRWTSMPPGEYRRTAPASIGGSSQGRAVASRQPRVSPRQRG
jgi:AraC-like DNA-binding protein